MQIGIVYVLSTLIFLVRLSGALDCIDLTTMRPEFYGGYFTQVGYILGPLFFFSGAL